VRIDVVFSGGAVSQSDVAGRVVGVIDVLRASTSIAAALANGARTVIPLESPDDVVTQAKAFERGDVRLAGERRDRGEDGSPRDDQRDARHHQHPGRA
jgi:2-phosphosulfolactate phosphatase